MRWFCGLLLVIATTLVASGQFYEGYVSPGGYVYRGGYWYYGNQAYTRTQVYYPGYWSYGVYYPGYYAYQYYPYYAPAYAAPATYDYKAELLKIAKEKVEFGNLLEGLKALGVGQVPMPGAMTYSGAAPYGMTGHYYANQYPVLGTTLYGYSPYSYNQLAVAYGDSSTASLFQAAAQLVQGAQKLSGDGVTSFHALVGRQGEANARVAEILAKAALVDRILQGINGTPMATTTGGSYKIGPDLKGPASPAPEAEAQVLEKWGSHVVAKCLNCHYKDEKGGGTVKGNFDVNFYLTMSDADKQKVWMRIDPSAPENIRMPRTADGKAGPPLTQEEVALWRNVKKPR